MALRPRPYLVILLISLTYCVAQEKLTPPTIIKGNTWLLKGSGWDIDGYTHRGGKNSSVINCQAIGNPKPEYIWTRNGEPVQNIPNTMEYDPKVGLLRLGEDFLRNLAGYFQCTAYNSQGTAMTPILKVSVARADPFNSDVPEEGVDAIRTEYLKLECDNMPASFPKPDFNWKMSQDDLDTAIILPKEESQKDPKDQNRVIIDTKGNLHFLNVMDSDAKSFTCGYHNSLIGTDMWSVKTLKLNVIKPVVENPFRPPELVFAEDVTVLEGDSATLMCIFKYYSKEGEQLKVDWYLNNQKESSHTGYKYEIKEVKIGAGVEGNYTCKAVVGQSKASGTVYLKIVAPPKFTKEGSKVVGAPQKAIVPQGKNAVFNCKTTSHNAYSTAPTWLVNAEPIIGCLPIYFQCKSNKADGSPQCIQKSRKCDAFNDCSDGSDEVGCPRACNEGNLFCYGQCIAPTETCEPCIYPHFKCDNNQCVRSTYGKSVQCDGLTQCDDGSDEVDCPGGPDFEVDGYQFNSQRTEMTIPKVELNNNLCVQCVVANRNGSVFGDACLTVIDKITVISEPNSTYTVSDGMFLNLYLEATTDASYANSLEYKWYWYKEVVDPDTEDTVVVYERLPPVGFEQYFLISRNGKNLTINLPEVNKEDDGESYKVYMMLTGQDGRIYAYNVSHDFDAVVKNFTIDGEYIEPPVIVPVTATASSNLWLIAVILGIIVLIALIVFIVCIVCKRDPRGHYYVDKKEHEAGNDPEQELKDSGFHDVGRVEDDDMDDKPETEKISLSESVNQYESDDDITAEYDGDFDISGKFNEDGSFIGMYGDKRSKTANSKEATV